MVVGNGVVGHGRRRGRPRIGPGRAHVGRRPRPTSSPRRGWASAPDTPMTWPRWRATAWATYAWTFEWARLEPTPEAWDAAAVEHLTDVLTATNDAGIHVWACLHDGSLPGWFAHDERGFPDQRSRRYFWARHVERVGEAFEAGHGWVPTFEPTWCATGAGSTATVRARAARRRPGVLPRAGRGRPPRRRGGGPGVALWRMPSRQRAVVGTGSSPPRSGPHPTG